MKNVGDESQRTECILNAQKLMPEEMGPEMTKQSVVKNQS